MTKNIIIKNKARKSFKNGSGINRVVSKGLFKKASFEKRFKGGAGTS